MQFLEKLTVVAKLFNQNNVEWKLGGSALLFMSGADIIPRDLDILIGPDSIELASSLLKTLGAVEIPDTRADDPEYLTETFIQLDWDHFEIDLMVNPGIENDLGRYVFNSDNEASQSTVLLGDEKIYLSSLIEWKQYYYYLKRPHRVAQIEQLLSETNKL